MDVIKRAFSAIDRKDFVPLSLRDQAHLDMPLPIGYGQTISQPSTVQSMLEWLGPEPGEKIMDIGSGSGWTTALLVNIVQPNGYIFAVERIPQLVQIGKNNCIAIGVKNASFFQAGKTYGLPEHAPFDRILVSAAANDLPFELLDQLKTGGKLVIPVHGDILEITKTAKQGMVTVKHHGYIFVPLIEPNA